MGQYSNSYKLSLYNSLTVLNETDKSKVELVQDIRNNKIYIMKTLSNYNLEVYKQLQKINNKGIPNIYEIIENDGLLVIIEEYINGTTLQDMLEEGPLSESLVKDYMIELCDIFNIIHNLDNPIIHRDIKPSNIIVDSKDNIILIDFDVSRVHKDNENRDTQILGTEGYAAPEQFGFEQTNNRSDIYSMGVLMNVLTTEKLPREERNKGNLTKIIEKCIKISPEERFKSVNELKSELQRSNEKIKIHKNPLRNIPGYRAKKTSYMISASIWYLFLLHGFTDSMRKGNTEEIALDVSIAIALLLITFLYGNFYNIKFKLPLIKDESKIKRVTGYVMFTLLICMLQGIITTLFK